MPRNVQKCRLKVLSKSDVQKWQSKITPKSEVQKWHWYFLSFSWYQCYYPHTSIGWVVSRMRDFGKCFPLFCYQTNIGWLFLITQNSTIHSIALFMQIAKVLKCCLCSVANGWRSHQELRLNRGTTDGSLAPWCMVKSKHSFHPFLLLAPSIVLCWFSIVNCWFSNVFCQFYVVHCQL